MPAPARAKEARSKRLRSKNESAAEPPATSQHDLEDLSGLSILENPQRGRARVAAGCKWPGRMFFQSRLDVSVSLVNECADPNSGQRCGSKQNTFASGHQLRSAPASATGRCVGSAGGAEAGCTTSL
jgi:hypothetical protein